tara:strand:- start:551 stop:859 length:309 start_codon:yes stop_codon:yes gene_type:complete
MEPKEETNPILRLPLEDKRGRYLVICSRYFQYSINYQNMKASLSPAHYGRTSLMTPYVFVFHHYKPRRSQFDATRLRDFMEFQGQLKISFLKKSKTIYTLLS